MASGNFSVVSIIMSTFTVFIPNYWTVSECLKTAKACCGTYSGELRLSPNVVRSMPGANARRLESVSAARINVKSPTIPNWSFTIPCGMLDTVPAIWIEPSVYLPKWLDRHYNHNPVFCTICRHNRRKQYTQLKHSIKNMVIKSMWIT